MAQKILTDTEDGNGDKALDDLQKQMVLHGQAKEGDMSIEEKEVHNFVSAMRRFWTRRPIEEMMLREG
jgi:hypothetical protein